MLPLPPRQPERQPGQPLQIGPTQSMLNDAE
jgi:hypothetical protein